MKYSISDLPPILLGDFEKPVDKPPANQGPSGVEIAAETGTPTFFDQVKQSEALSLYSVVRELRPTASFEIGFCCGASGLAILKALHDNQHGQHFSCDPYQSSYAKNAGRRNVSIAGLEDRWTLFENFPEEIVTEIPPIQFAFIDASHLFDLSLLDFILVDKRLEPGGVVAFHDMWMPSLRKVIRYILSNRSYKIHRPTPESTSRIPISTTRRLFCRALRAIPRSEKIFAPELLTPWGSFGLGNLAFLQKVQNDERPWRFHKTF